MAGYTDWVEQILNLWTDETGIETPWFRGAGDSNFKLVPGLYRSAAGREENADDELRTEFSRKALAFVADRVPGNDWEWYFLMQHYRAPTRLLDWTDAALVALYFALTSWAPRKTTKVPHTKPAVWALNPFTLNKYSHSYGPVNTNFEEARPYLPDPYAREKLPEFPIAIDPPFTAQRMLVQHSHFTLHGRDVRGLDEMQDELSLRNGLYKVTIDLNQDGIEYLQQHLAVLGVTETTIFPDLEGLARELRIDYRLDAK